MKEGITLKQTDEAKLERSREILEALKEAWGRKLLNSCFRHWKPLEIFSKQSTWKKNKYKHRYVKTK